MQKLRSGGSRYMLSQIMLIILPGKEPGEMARKRTTQAVLSASGWVPSGVCVSLSREEEISTVTSHRTSKTGIYRIRICNGGCK